MATIPGSVLRDGLSATAFIILGGYGLVEARQFDDRAAAWPLWMFGALVAFSLIVLVDAIRRWLRERRS